MRGLNADLLHLAEEAGVDKVVLDYLRAEEPYQQSMAKNWEEVDAVLEKPLETGHTVDGVKHQVAEADIPLAKAQIRYLWKISHDQLESTAAGTPTTTQSTPSTTNKAGQSKTPPKELPPDVTRELLAKYEDQKIDGERREFPQRMLLGCEKIIARMWWEMENHMHTPLQLHELMASRVIDAAGNPNPLAQTNDTKHNKVTLDLTLGLGTANISDETRWSPKGVLSLLDALEAIEWAMILVRMGTEAEVRACISWWRCLVRTKTQKLEHIKAYWLEANWKLCLELRQGADFQQHALQAALQKELPAPMPKMKPQAPTRQHKHEPYRTDYGQGKGSNKRWASQGSWQQRQDKKQDARYNQSHKYNSGTGGQPLAQGQLGASQACEVLGKRRRVDPQHPRVSP